MVRKRVVGEIGDGVTVLTEWFEDPESGMLTGIKIGLEARGWRDIHVETEDE